MPGDYATVKHIGKPEQQGQSGDFADATAGISDKHLPVSRQVMGRELSLSQRSCRGLGIKVLQNS